MGRVEQEKSNYGSRFDQSVLEQGFSIPWMTSQKTPRVIRKRVGVRAFMHGLLGPCDGGCS